MRENFASRLALGDHGEHAQSAVALGALEDVHLEGAPQQRGPVDTRRDCVKQAAEQAVPVLHCDDVGREERDVAGSGPRDGRWLAGRRF